MCRWTIVLSCYNANASQITYLHFEQCFIHSGSLQLGQKQRTQRGVRAQQLPGTGRLLRQHGYCEPFNLPTRDFTGAIC